MNDIEKWKHAVVHIEGATDSTDPSLEAWQLLREGRITGDEWYNLASNRTTTRDERYQGTAVFVVRDGNYYLVTARHVLYDETSANRQIKVAKDAYDRDPTPRGEDEIKRAEERAEGSIFSIIFRVPLYGELNKPSGGNFLMNLSAGTWPSNTYTYSSPDIDLAVVSLNDSFTQAFRNDLLSNGYIPIDYSDISLDTPKEGEDVMAVGYPFATAIVDEIHMSQSELMWASNNISLPIFSFGKAAMYTDDLPYFWADLSIYPGNSGGAVVNKNKLVGIVSGQANTPIDEDPSLYTRIPFAYIIRSRHIIEIMNQQRAKENSNKWYTQNPEDPNSTKGHQ